MPALQESQLAKDNAEFAARLAKELPLQNEALTQSSRYATGMGMQVCGLIATRMFALQACSGYAYLPVLSAFRSGDL